MIKFIKSWVKARVRTKCCNPRSEEAERASIMYISIVLPKIKILIDRQKYIYILALAVNNRNFLLAVNNKTASIHDYC